jgi:HEPN domain-containing protein
MRSVPPDTARLAETAAWLRKARGDMQGAELGPAADPPLLEDAAFHTLQAVEKTLQAFLVRHQRPLRKTHGLGEIGQLCLTIDPWLEPLCRRADLLTVYARAFRYPGDMVAPLAEEVEHALALAREVWGAVLSGAPADPGLAGETSISP